MDQHWKKRFAGSTLQTSSVEDMEDVDQKILIWRK